MIRWPGRIKAGEVSNEIVSGLDWFPTLVAAAGDTDVKDRLLKGTDLSGKSFKVHLDGYNQLPYLTGQAPKSARNEFFYFNDDGGVVAYRYNDWKIVFCEQRQPGGFIVWANPFTCLRAPKVFNLRMDPFERADVVSEPVLRLVGQERLSHSIRRMAGRAVPADLQGLSAEPAARELQHRPDGRCADEVAGQDGREIRLGERASGLEAAGQHSQPAAANGGRWTSRCETMNDLDTSTRQTEAASASAKRSTARDALLDLKARIGKSVLGQDRMVESMLIGIAWPTAIS
jgi:hypothetical protein